MDGGIFDISDPAQPKLVWSLDMNPPHRGPHTVSPIVYDTVPNFGKSALPRTYAFVVDEAGGAADMEPCPERRAPRLVHARHHQRDEAVSGVGVAGAGRQLLRRRAAASGRTSRPTR